MELDIERDASNKDLYKYDSKEKKEKKDYRHKKINDDIRKRFKILSEYTGFERFNLNADGIGKRALIKLLEKKGIFTDGEYLDIYYLIVDEEIRNLEKRKDELKKERISKFLTNKIITPGAINFKREPGKIIRG